MPIDSEKYNRILDGYSIRRNRALEQARMAKKDFLRSHPDVADIEARIRRVCVKHAIESIRQGSSGSAELIKGGSPESVPGSVRAGSLEHESYDEELKKLYSIKKELLDRYGVRHDAFEPRFECKKCKDTGFVDGQKCSCLKKRIIENIYDTSHLGDILEEENFQNFNLEYYSDQIKDPNTGKSARECAQGAYNVGWEFVNNFDTKFQNLLIMGGTGVGKTFLSHCIAKELLDRGKSVIYLTAFKLFDSLSAQRFGNASGEEADRSQIEQCDLLIIDDLGSEMSNRFTRTELFAVINERILNKKPVIISTNLSIPAILEQYTERVYSRIYEYYEAVELVGHDIRTQKSMEVI